MQTSQELSWVSDYLLFVRSQVCTKSKVYFIFHVSYTKNLTRIVPDIDKSAVSVKHNLFHYQNQKGQIDTFTSV